MTRRIPALAVFVLIPLGLALASPSANAAESYESCSGFITSLPATITTQGTWCLDQDLSTTLTSGNAITIATNNVTLDCNHFKLGGLGAGLGTQANGVFAAARQNVTVRNCNIRGFYVGAILDGAGHVLEDSRFESNRYYGVYVSASSGEVRRNQVLGTGGAGGTPVGIFVSGGIDVMDNLVHTVTADPGGTAIAIGVDVSGVGARVIANNRIRNIFSGASSPSFAITTSISTSSGISIRGNSLANPAGYEGNVVGIGCFTPGGVIASGNHVQGFSVGIEANCHEGGGNVTLPEP